MDQWLLWAVEAEVPDGVVRCAVQRGRSEEDGRNASLETLAAAGR